MQQLKRGALLGLALVSCPCHVPILLILLAGTGVGAVLAPHSGLVFGALLLIFLGAVAALLRTYREPREVACPRPTTPQPPHQDRVERGTPPVRAGTTAVPLTQE